MDETLEIVYVEKPEEQAWGIIGRGVHEHNLAQADDEGFRRVCYALQTADGTIVGGVLGEIYWGWFYVDLMWVAEELRGRGHGRRLLARAEEEARRLGARQAYLDTFSFQAPAFYEKQGYAVFGELADFPPGQRRIFMTKQL